MLMLQGEKHSVRISPMANSSDTCRARSLKAEFDPNFSATPHAGGALLARVMRRLGVRHCTSLLPARRETAEYKAADSAEALIVGLLMGGKGLGAAEILRNDEDLAEIAGIKGLVAEEASMNRVLADMAGLPYRKMNEAYELVADNEAADLFDNSNKPRRRRVVTGEVENACKESMEQLGAFNNAIAARAAKAIGAKSTMAGPFTLLFGDATDLEVRGSSFDAARRDHNGNKSMRLMTVMCGPLVHGSDLLPGASDEATAMRPLLERSFAAIQKTLGGRRKYLSLMDAAYAEAEVINWHKENGAHFIIGANRLRVPLQKLAEESALHWRDSGADLQRGWEESQVAAFTYKADSWIHPVTIIARRYRKIGEMFFKYSFIATDLEPRDLPSNKLRKIGYCSTVWSFYNRKQAQENHYKTLLSDLGLHHPPSSRFGINQVFYGLAIAAANIAFVMRFRVMTGEAFEKARDAGIRLWRLREKYLRIAGYLVRSGGALTVRLAGASIPLELQQLWELAFERAACI